MANQMRAYMDIQSTVLGSIRVERINPSNTEEHTPCQSRPTLTRRHLAII